MPEFFLKEKQVSLPTLSNARGINEAEKEGRDLVYATKESPGNTRTLVRGSSRELAQRNALAANSVQALHSFSQQHRKSEGVHTKEFQKNLRLIQSRS